MKSGLRWYWNRIKSYIGRPRLIIQQKPVILDDHEPCQHPIFILGAHRSGTSLLRRMLNSHPEIACPPESFFIAHYAAMQDEELCIAGYDGLGYDREAMRADLARKASELHEAFRISQSKAIWADKTPQYLAIAEQIDVLFARQPRYLLIYRHPCDIVHSLHKRGWKQNEIEDDFDAALHYVHLSIKRLDAFFAAHPGRCARFDYKDLCCTTETTLRTALDQIGLAYDPAMLDFADRQHNYGLEDPVIHGQPKIKESSGAWRSWNSSQMERAIAIFGPRAREDIYWDFAPSAKAG